MAIDPTEQYSPFAFGYDQSNIASLPESTLKQLRDYGNALRTGSGQQPVRHWTQGVSNIVNAYMGGKEQALADAMERAKINAMVTGRQPTGYGAPGASPASATPPLPGPAVSAAPAPAPPLSAGVPPSTPGSPWPATALPPGAVYGTPTAALFGSPNDRMMLGMFGPNLG